MAWAALQVAEDDAFGFTPAGPAGCARFTGDGLGAEKIIQSQSEQAAAADAQNIAPRGAEAFVTEIFAGSAWNAEHGRAGSVVLGRPNIESVLSCDNTGARREVLPDL